EDEAFGGGQGHGRGRGASHRFALGDRAEIFFDPGLGITAVEITDDGDGTVVGGVIEAEKTPDIFEGGGGEVVHGADDRPGIWMAFRIHGFADDFTYAAVGFIVHALAAFVFDDVALGVELGKVHRIKEETHAIGLEPEGG